MRRPLLISWNPISRFDTPSSRVRAFLPCKHLREAGWPCEIFDYKNKNKYKIVVFQKRYDEESINLAKSLRHNGAKVIFDLCDNHFYNPDNSSILRERVQRLKRIIDIADSVTVSTLELKKYVRHRNVIVIDDAIYIPPPYPFISHYLNLRNLFAQRYKRSLKIIWYGIAGMEGLRYGIIDLQKVLPFLETLNIKLPVSLTVISNSEKLFKRYINGLSFPAFYHAWRTHTFSSIFRQHDICIIPIDINPFTTCKTNNRIMLSLLLGVPVIADKIPSYEEFKDFALFDDWENSLYLYATNEELRNRHIKEAKKYIYSKYNKERVVSQWGSVFNELLGKGR